MPLLGSINGVFCGFQARVELVHLNQKSRVFVNPTGVLSNGCIKHTGPERQGRMLIMRAVGEVM